MIELKKTPCKEFRILNLTDIQITAEDIFYRSACLELFLKTVNRLMRETEPGLITVSGDISYGDAPEFKTVYAYFADFLESFGVPWAVVFGNHDNQGGTERINEIVNIFQKRPHFCYECGDSTLGNGNYIIKITEQGKAAAGIIMADSHDRVPCKFPDGEMRGAWAKLTEKQLDWYKEQANALSCPSALILHIPFFAYKTAFSEAFKSGINPLELSLRQSYEKEFWNEGYEGSFGVCYEGISSYPKDDGAFDAIESTGFTKLVLCGHDHVNCTSICYRGVRLMYAMKTGSGCYCDSRLNGGTLITIDNGEISADHIVV